MSFQLTFLKIYSDKILLIRVAYFLSGAQKKSWLVQKPEYGSSLTGESKIIKMVRYISSSACLGLAIFLLMTGYGGL